ncbi:uncharacterized protein N7511_007627 [Penicillium nucicola]|uniref:uncharacterized protein n=1 Tax=Penicillium nucicola TaxID=1850975 RepID=UPI002544FB06|nr:uncharacterized protein N7511_007627 [Penicillium nucicola]KAJ5753474.1 hypothetical protein N7511_007627 [Penicillium nucicola]
MGFGSFLSQAVGAVKNIVSHSPIVKALAPLGGIIAHAVPGVGPIIDSAIPAVQVIFSKDNTAPNAGEEPKPPTFEQLNTPVLVELKRQNDEIQSVLKTAEGLKSTLRENFEEMKKDFQDKLDLNMEETLKALAIDEYDELFMVVRESVKWFQMNQLKLSVTAQDGPEKIKALLHDHENLPSVQSKLKQCIVQIETKIANLDPPLSQQMLDLYLLGIHWLLIYDKAVVVTRGIYARALFVGQKWLAYLNTVNNLNNDINELRRDAINARDVLQALIKNVPVNREGMIKIINPGNSQPQYIQDDWPTLSVGSIPLMKLMVELGVKDQSSVKSQKALVFDDNVITLAHSLWKTYAVQALEFNLGPAHAVMNHLEESIRQWNSRVPVAPTKNLPRGQDHVKATVVKSKETPEAKSISLKEEFFGKKLHYALTYYNTYGESSSSGWTTDKCLIENDTHAVKVSFLDVHPVKFDNDPLDALDPIKVNGRDLAPERSIRRKLYVKYTENHGDTVVLYLGDVTEDENIVYHVFDEKLVGKPNAPRP